MKSEKFQLLRKTLKDPHIFENYYQIGWTLSATLKGKLYDATHPSFEAYITEQYNQDLSWAYRHINAYKLFLNILKAGSRVQTTVADTTDRLLLGLIRKDHPQLFPDYTEQDLDSRKKLAWFHATCGLQEIARMPRLIDALFGYQPGDADYLMETHADGSPKELIEILTDLIPYDLELLQAIWLKDRLESMGLWSPSEGNDFALFSQIVLNSGR